MTDMTDDHGDWLHECRKDRRLDEAAERRCECCVNYRAAGVKRFAGKESFVWRRVPQCALGRELKPCEQYEREPGADDD